MNFPNSIFSISAIAASCSTVMADSLLGSTYTRNQYVSDDESYDDDDNDDNDDNDDDDKKGSTKES